VTFLKGKVEAGTLKVMSMTDYFAFVADPNSHRSTPHFRRMRLLK